MHQTCLQYNCSASPFRDLCLMFNVASQIAVFFLNFDNVYSTIIAFTAVVKDAWRNKKFRLLIDFDCHISFIKHSCKFLQ